MQFYKQHMGLLWYHMASTWHQRAKLHHSKFARTEEIGHYRARKYNTGQENFGPKRLCMAHLITFYMNSQAETATCYSRLFQTIKIHCSPLRRLHQNGRGRVRRQRGRTLLKRATHRALTWEGTRTSKEHEPGLLWSRCSSCEKHPPMDHAFPSNRALVPPSHRPPPARSTPPTTPLLTQNRNRPTRKLPPHQQATSTGTIPPAAAWTGILGARIRRRSSCCSPLHPGCASSTNLVALPPRVFTPLPSPSWPLFSVSALERRSESESEQKRAKRRARSFARGQSPANARKEPAWIKINQTSSNNLNQTFIFLSLLVRILSFWLNFLCAIVRMISYMLQK